MTSRPFTIESTLFLHVTSLLLSTVFIYNIELVKHDFLPRGHTAQLELTLDVNVSYICSV